MDSSNKRHNTFSSFRRNSKKKKKKRKDEENFAEKEENKFRSRKRYLENNLEDPEINEELNYNSED